jgi:acyl-CoA reductase-like NAD-dependent aldehyde dehydrogenase
VYPGGGDVGAAVLDSCGRNLIFGGTATVDRYRGNPRVQAHGPGFSKILLGDDQVDRWEQFVDVMADSVFLNSGRGCINCSGIWASRHTREIADALARRLAAIAPLPPDHPDASLAAFTVPGAAEAIDKAIDADLQAPGVTDVTAAYRDSPRLIKQERADYLLPTVVHCSSRTRRSPARSTCSPSSPSSNARKRGCSTRSARRWCAARSRATRRSAGGCSTPCTSIG